MLFIYRIAYRMWLLVGMSGWRRLYLKTCKDLDCLIVHEYHILQNNFQANVHVFNESVLLQIYFSCMCTILLVSMNMTSWVVSYFVKIISKRLVATEDFLVELKAVQVVCCRLLYLLMSAMGFPCKQSGVSQTKRSSNAMSSSPIQDNAVPQCQGLAIKFISFL